MCILLERLVSSASNSPPPGQERHSDTCGFPGFRVASFIDHVFHVLDIVELESSLVRDRLDCVLQCLEDQRCFSTNLAAKPDITGNYVCELLPTDKYNASDSFKPSPHFHHYSVKLIDRAMQKALDTDRAGTETKLFV
ncbi:hypothetical protein pdam_00012777 [Pocillopora damicornis]|uniref:Apple domain-containing protein n=1 Tax=Pocillopora damicornis TaxID=46731 RepID=A0A3M6TIX8_POCDA|nr:hypothetical protein pdam_00012777 [Pocillopora damicornis]